MVKGVCDVSLITFVRFEVIFRSYFIGSFLAIFSCLGFRDVLWFFPFQGLVSGFSGLGFFGFICRLG